jgi:hypothetical protein
MYLFSSDSVEVDIDGMQGFQWMNEWMNEWLLLNANSAIFHLYHGENKWILNEMMMRSALF